MARWASAPAIVAEALVGVSDPLLTALPPLPESAPALVANRLAQSLVPPADPVEAPAWLLTQQVQSFRQVVAAIRRYQGALLADPVGSGKTYVALAVAKALNRGSTACLVPAGLIRQWQATAARLGVPVKVCSHEQVSRGRLPRDTRGLVLIDESHHFRHCATRRYRNLAPWLVDRPALLLTATPIVNRLNDLTYQLLLCIRDNALAPEGITSIRAMLALAVPSPALERIVIETDSGMGQRPQRMQRSSPPIPLECQQSSELVGLIDRLQCSKSPAITRLIRGVLTRAAASSPAALNQALRRYRRLLLHARDSIQAGRPVVRSELRRLTSDLDAQLIWWELFPGSPGEVEIELADLAEIGELICEVDARASAGDPKVGRLREVLADGVPSLVFSTWRDTVHYLRRRLPEFRIAWCTGERAGIGITPMARPDVLDWFRQSSNSQIGPAHLIVSDVAAEGLDLQRAARVIHYDLPWTPMRLEQREGRSIRLGSAYSQVEVIRFQASPQLESRIRTEAILARKSKLPALVGLGPDGSHVWRWRTTLASKFKGSGAEGVATAPHPENGLLAGFGLYRQGVSMPVSSSLLWMNADGSWTEAPDVLERHLHLAADQSCFATSDPERVQEWLRLLTRPIRERLALAQGWRWIAPAPSSAGRRVLARLQSLIAEASRRHQPDRLARLERVLAFVSEGHTAGEEMLVDSMLQLPEAQLLDVPRQLLRGGPMWAKVEARLHGLLLFGPAQLGRVTLASPQCQRSPRRSLTSMEP